MPNAEKIARVEALKERIESSEALLLTEYRGLTVHDATELRRSLSDHAGFSVVKNTLMQRAAGDAGIVELKALLEGPTAVAFVSGDVVSVAELSRWLPRFLMPEAEAPEADATDDGYSATDADMEEPALAAV